MKTKWKIILGVTGILILSAGYYGYRIFKSVHGGTELAGTQSQIPQNMKEMPPLNKDSADWTNWRGSIFDGKATWKGIKTDWTDSLSKVWSVDYLCQGRATASWSAPVVQGDRLVVMGRDDKNDLVFCLHAHTGEMIWHTSYEADAGESHGPGARATPFIDNDRVYTFGRSGDLTCWNLYDGKKIWQKSVMDIGGEEPEWGHSSSPLVYGNHVIVQGGGKALVCAYDKINGELAWKSLEGKAGYAAPVPIRLDEEEFLLVFHGGGLSLIHPKDGKENWNTPWITDYGVNATTPVYENNLVFITSGYGKGGQAIKAGKEKLNVEWTNQAIASHHSDPILIDGYIYGYSGQSNNNRGDFKCIELATGKEIWTTKDFGWGTVVYVDGHFLALDIKGNLYLFKADNSGYTKVAELKKAIPSVQNPAWTIPVVANGKLYLRYMQHLICYDIKK
jgi:outer membrane protein assembly factor BamB